MEDGGHKENVPRVSTLVQYFEFNREDGGRKENVLRLSTLGQYFEFNREDVAL